MSDVVNLKLFTYHNGCKIGLFLLNLKGTKRPTLKRCILRIATDDTLQGKKSFLDRPALAQAYIHWLFLSKGCSQQKVSFLLTLLSDFNGLSNFHFHIL